jgi:transcriptional regulator with XRE-family HTH domain
MGKAGQALKQTLDLHNISQNRLAIALGVERPIVFRWFHEKIDPTGETIHQITTALQTFDPDAANSFVNFYLGNFTQNSSSGTSPQSLPESKQINVSILVQLFNKTTNSYKYLFFLSLLDILKRRKFDVLSPISFVELIVEILANAWFPHTYFKLSFGTQDKIAEKLDSLNLIISEPILKFNDPHKQLLRKTIENQTYDDLIAYLVKYVPFRLIRPFYSHETRGLKDVEVNQTILNLTNNNHKSRNALYHFDADLIKDCKGIILSQDWANYIEENFEIVKGWASWEWLQYMQSRNPTTPNIVNKLFMPQQRGSLSSQTKFWKFVLDHQSLNCIYSNQKLNPNYLSLDHYLPWSFVAHDQLWNLVPVIPEANSSKSDNLPAAQYFYDFVNLQHLALVTHHECLPKQSWNKAIDHYVADLGLSENDLLDLDRLLKAYESTVKPLITLAAKQGFSENWVYPK